MRSDYFINEKNAKKLKGYENKEKGLMLDYIQDNGATYNQIFQIYLYV